MRRREEQAKPAEDRSSGRSPTTSAGRLLRSLLVAYCSDTTMRDDLTSIVEAFVRLGHIQATSGMVAYAFTIMVRRRFAREQDVRIVTRYVREALSRVDPHRVDGERLRRAEATVRAALGETWLVEGIDLAERGEIMLTLLGDLVETEGITTRQLNELIMAAEIHNRLFPVHGEPGRQYRLRGLKGRSADSSPTVDPPSSHGPRSATMQWLRAYIIAGTRALPPRPRGTRNDQAVVDAAFEVVTRCRFREGQNPRDISLCIQNAHKGMPDSTISVRDIELVIREQLGEPVPVDGFDGRRRLRARILATVFMANELGLLRSELDALLADPEALAVDRGFTPEPAA